VLDPPPVNIEIGLSESVRCGHCRAETVEVTVDAGGGPDLPLFLMGKPLKPGDARAVQIIREGLSGRLCLNCGLLTAQVTLSKPELGGYRGQLARLSRTPVSGSGSSLAPTRIQSPRRRNVDT